MRIVVLSDTHAPRRWKSCPPAVAARLRDADLILHAGDVCTGAVLDELAQYAPVTAVVGNNDGPLGLLHVADGALVEARIVAVS